MVLARWRWSGRSDKTYGPCETKRSRCKGVMKERRNKIISSMMEVSSRFTEQLVFSHDLLSKDNLERVRQYHEAGEGLWRTKHILLVSGTARSVSHAPWCWRM